METEQHNTPQHEGYFLNPFFELFYRDDYLNEIKNNETNYYGDEDRNKDIHCKINLEQDHLDILVCGAGAGILEFPLLLSLLSKYKTANIIFIDKVYKDDKDYKKKTPFKPFKLLETILKKSSTRGKDDIISEYEDCDDICLEQKYFATIAKCEVTYTFFHRDLEFNPNVENKNYINEVFKNEKKYNDFLSSFIDIFNGNQPPENNIKAFDIVIMSTLLQHISYWRSLISYTNSYLKDNGFHFISELGGDDFALSLDIYSGIIDSPSPLQKIFTELIEEPFSIISDNNELSATNLETCEHFFDFFGAKKQCSKDFTIENLITKDILLLLFDPEKPIFSPYKRYYELELFERNYIIEKIKQIDEPKEGFKASFSLKWKFFKKITQDNRVCHFNVIDKKEIVSTMSIKDLQRYITETLDILNRNKTIFSAKFITRDYFERREKMIKYTIELFARFILFKIDKTKMELFAFFINDIFVFPQVTINDVERQKILLNGIKKYNEEIETTSLKINELLFDIYINTFTKPFVFILDKKTNDQYDDGLFEKGLHIVRLSIDSDHKNQPSLMKTKLGSKIQKKLDEKKEEIFELLAKFFKNVDCNQTFLVPCFRENFTDSNKIEKEFTAALFLFPPEYISEKYITEALPFYSWLIKKFIDFSNIGNAIVISNYKTENMKSAVAAIMSRNMSHNLGSHILFYIKEHLKNVKTILKGNILAELINATITDTDWDNNDFSLKLKIKECLEEELKNKQGTKEYNDELPFLVGLGHFISYLQERQDYIATICTGYVPYFSSVDFKQAIYDELTPDACQARHSEREGEKSENLLLQYIAKSEGFGRKIENNNYGCDNIVIKFRKFDGLNKDHEELKNMRKIKLSLPGGYTGRQAFFSIFENIIRNSAKHGKLNFPNTNLEFTIDVWEKSNLDREEDTFWDVYKKSSDINDLHIIKITDNCEIDGNILQILEDNLKDIYIDKNGKLKETNKGLKEMRISAAWLRNELYNIEKHINNTKAPILQVRKTKKNNLEYVFCIQRPKEIAFIVARNNINKLQNIQNFLQEQYCKLFSVKEFKDDTKLNYNFIICEDEIYNDILPYSHNLIIKKGEIDELSSLLKNYNHSDVITKKNKIKKIKERIFKNFLNMDNNIDVICISDDEVKRIIDRYKEDEKVQIKEYVNIIDGGPINEKYIYITHFENAREFYSFMKENFHRIEQIEFVEGITGHNSTARLLRTEEIDKLWYYKHLNAMKTEVAVFDERFFDRYTKISHKEILQYDWWTKIMEQNEPFDLIKEEIQNKDNGNIINLNNKIRYRIDVKDLECLKAFMDKEATVKSEFKTEKLSPYLYKLKGVEFFNIVWREITKEFVIVGYSDVKHSNENAEYKYYYCIYKVIGTISYQKNSQVEIELVDGYQTKFDFISIHQGLLDKIYAQFNIKKADLESRAKVTKGLHEKFSNTKPVPMKIEENNYNYLPKFIIHSGRSKPSNEDMPQHQPFIQFSALENVIADCKYSLVELLNMAHYE